MRQAAVLMDLMAHFGVLFAEILMWQKGSNMSSNCLVIHWCFCATRGNSLPWRIVAVTWGLALLQGMWKTWQMAELCCDARGTAFASTFARGAATKLTSRESIHFERLMGKFRCF